MWGDARLHLGLSSWQPWAARHHLGRQGKEAGGSSVPDAIVTGSNSLPLQTTERIGLTAEILKSGRAGKMVLKI